MLVFFVGSLTKRNVLAEEENKTYFLSTEQNVLLVDVNEEILIQNIKLHFNNQDISGENLNFLAPSENLEITQTYLKAKTKGSHRFLLQYYALNMYAYLISKESSEESYDLYQNDFDSIPSGSLPEGLVTISGNPSVVDGKLVELINGDFSTEQVNPIPQPATTGWGWHGDGTFTVDIPGGPDGKATINVTNPGTVPHAVQFYQQNKYIEANAIYKFKFTMKAETATNIRLSLEARTTLRDFKFVPITTTMETYEFYMTPSGGSFTNAKIAFFLGKVDANSVANIYEIDDVSFELAGYAEPFGQTNFLGVDNKEIVVGTAFDKLAGVTIYDYFDASLKLTDVVVEGEVDVNTEGTYTLTYKITNIWGIESVVTRTITVKEE